VFRETQQLPKWAAALLGLAIAPVGWGLYRQVVLGRPWGDRPVPDWMLFAILAFLVLMCAGLLRSRLLTEVRHDELYLRYAILLVPVKKHIPYGDIVSAEARSYRPLVDCGGWGIRIGREGRCWTVRGSQGVFLRLSNGDGFLLGSQESEALAAAIRERLRGPRYGASGA
jgi:hypothetical protein